MSRGAGSAAYVRYGTGWGSASAVEADIVNLIGAVPNSPQGTLAGNQFYVKALLTHLDPGARYSYRVELSDGTKTGEAIFTTAPDRRGLGDHTGGAVPGPFTFTSFGDHGTNSSPTDPAFAYAMTTPYTWPNAIFDDNYYNPTDPVLAYDPTPAQTMTTLVADQQPRLPPGERRRLLRRSERHRATGGQHQRLGTHGGAPAGTNAYNPYVWDVYLAQIEAVASTIPWMISTGNHDMEALYGVHGYGGHPPGSTCRERPVGLPVGLQLRLRQRRRDQHRRQRSVVRDPDEPRLQRRSPVLVGRDARSRAWRNDSTIDFIVMFMHHCAFSTSGAHASDLGVRALVGMLADKYQVDLVLSGHNHQTRADEPDPQAQRSALDAPDGTTFDATRGTTYLTVGFRRPAALPVAEHRRRAGHDRHHRPLPQPHHSRRRDDELQRREDVHRRRHHRDRVRRLVADPLPRLRTCSPRRRARPLRPHDDDDLTVVADGDRTSNVGGVPIDRVTLTRIAGAGDTHHHD